MGLDGAEVLGGAKDQLTADRVGQAGHKLPVRADDQHLQHMRAVHAAHAHAAPAVALRLREHRLAEALCPRQGAAVPRQHARGLQGRPLRAGKVRHGIKGIHRLIAVRLIRPGIDRHHTTEHKACEKHPWQGMSPFQQGSTHGVHLFASKIPPMIE